MGSADQVANPLNLNLTPSRIVRGGKHIVVMGVRDARTLNPSDRVQCSKLHEPIPRVGLATHDTSGRTGLGREDGQELLQPVTRTQVDQNLPKRAVVSKSILKE